MRENTTVTGAFKRIHRWERRTVSGDESVESAEDLVGRWVNFILVNGICVVGVQVLNVRRGLCGGLHLVYRLPNTAADSEVSLSGIGHLHVFGTKESPRPQINYVYMDYPRTVNGHTVWACCESTIGPTCEHRTSAS